MHWFTKSWWGYLLAQRVDRTSWISVIVCRVRGHPCGPVYFNVSGTEPNWHCKNCGDYIG